MALLYLDTSALVKIYLDETGSERMRKLASPDEGNRLATCSITQVEFHAAIWRRRREGEFDGDTTERTIEQFNGRLRDDFLRRPVDDRTLDLASELISRHPLRGYDATQLAACLDLARAERELPTFVCADRRLLTAAIAEGLPVLDPSEAEEPPVQDSAAAEEPPVLDPAESEEPQANPPSPSP